MTDELRGVTYCGFLSVKVVQALELIERDPWLVSICQGKAALHLGCAGPSTDPEPDQESRILHQRLAAGAREIVGVDIRRPGIKEAPETDAGPGVSGLWMPNA